MHIQLKRFGLILAATLFFAAGCDSSSESDEPSAPKTPKTAETSPVPAEAVPQASAKSIEKAAKRFTLKKIIQAHREQLKNAPGRTGILKEKKRYSLFDEELIIRDFFQDREGGYFVDVGCAWPIIANNTYYLEKHLGWTGVGIDALEEHAPIWRRDRPGSKFFTYLVTDHSGTEDSFYKSQSRGLSSADRGRADGKHFGGTLEVEEVKVQSITLTDLLDNEGIGKIDLLAMDIEGHELNALHGFDIDRFRPELVVTEGKRPDVAAFFEEHGYEVIERYRAFDLVNDYFRRSDRVSTTP